MSKSLFSVTPDPLTGGGIFSALQSLSPPWADEGIALLLDLIYYGNVSGSKSVSPLVERIMTSSKLSEVQTATLAGALMATNSVRWSREWATRSAQYDPIENYRMVEEMTDDETVTEYGRHDTRTDNLQHGETRTDNLAHSETRTDNLQHSETRTDNLTHRKTGTETESPDVTVTENNDIYGFNSSSAVHDSKRTQSSDGSSETTYNLTETDTGTVGTQGSNTGTQSTQGTDTGTQSTQGTDTGTQTNVASGSDTSTRNYQLTRSGNIGVTTSQQMLQSERDLWMWSFFYDVVFPDVDTLLTIPTYAEEEESGISGGIIPIGTIVIIANGDYDVTEFALARVAVSNSYTVSDIGKVVKSIDGVQILTNQIESVLVTTNGELDTTYISGIQVSVPNRYTASDEGKVVSGGALVAQTGPLVITENGLFNTTTIGSVNVIVPEMEYLANYDFTESLIDSVNGFEAVPHNADRDAEGIHLTTNTSYITTPNTLIRGLKLDVEITGSTRGGGDHARLVVYGNTTGLIYRNTGNWGFYNGGGWSDSDITDFNYFDDHIMRIFIDKDNYWHIYRDDTLVFEPSRAGNSGELQLGSTGSSFFTTTVKSLRIYS